MAECQEIEVYKPPDLNARLKKEQDMLEQYFCPEKYPILHKDDTPCFEHEVKLKEDRTYKLRVYVNSQYPNRLPDLVVCESPEPMPDGPDWNSPNGSHDTHTYQRMYGFLHICHWHRAAWTSENMIYQVFNKGEEWLEAYEKYLITKKLPLELKQMELTEEEKRRVAQQDLQQRVLSQQFLQLQQLARLQPNFLNQLWMDIWCTFGITSDILSQNNLPSRVPVITDDEIIYMQRLFSGGMMPAQLTRFRCALDECKAVWPNWLVVLLKFLSHRLMMELLASTWENMYVGPRSLQNN